MVNQKKSANSMFYIFLSLIFFTSAVRIGLSKPKLKNPQKAKSIARKMINRDDGRSYYNKVLLVSCAFVRKNGKNRCSSRPRKKVFESLSKDVGRNLKDTTGLSIIIEPPSERNVVFLQKDYDNEKKDSDQWMYLPALKKLKRIVSESRNSPKTGTFFGSEIAYEDMEKTHLSDYYYSLEGEENVAGRSSYVIVMYPTRKRAPRTSYKKLKSWIDKKSYLMLKGQFYDRRGRLAKTLYAKGIVQRKGVYISTRIIIVNHTNQRMSMMKIQKMAMNIPIASGLLSPRAIKDSSFREAKLAVIRRQAR